jgi:hypothetical protein
MSPPPPLALVARERNWMDFALLLEAAMAQAPSYGLPDAFAVRAAVARMRRQLPSSLVTAIKAMEYLRANRPDVLAARDASIGCAQVRLLARLAAAAPEAAAAVEADVLRGALRMADLRAVAARATACHARGAPAQPAAPRPTLAPRRPARAAARRAAGQPAHLPTPGRAPRHAALAL